MITPSELQTTNDILDNDIVMVTHNNGETETISGADLNKRNQTIIASGTTITGAPLKTGNVVRVMFTQSILGIDTITPLIIKYNGSDYLVKVGKDGALAGYFAFEISTGVYKYLQAYTTLEMVYDGTQFIIIGNPVVLSNAQYIIHADGNHVVNKVTADNMHSVTSNAVYDALSGHSKIKVARVTKSRSIFQKSQYGFVEVSGFPTDFTNADVIGSKVVSDGVFDAYGLQITYVAGENGTHYFWYYIPNHIDFDYNNRYITFQLTYFSNT